MVRLPKHRSGASHLKKEPLEGRVSRGASLGEQLAGLVGEVDENGARFEDRLGRAACAVVVDDGRDLVIGADTQEVRRELLASAQIDHAHLVGEAELLERDGDFETVGGGCRVEVDHAPLDDEELAAVSVNERSQ